MVLNKVDLLGEGNVPELTAMINTINPMSEVVACSHGKVRHALFCSYFTIVCAAGQGYNDTHRAVATWHGTL